MPAPRPFIGDRELHLIGMILDEFTDIDMEDACFSPKDRVRAEALFDDLNRYLTEKLGMTWNEQAVDE